MECSITAEGINRDSEVVKITSTAKDLSDIFPPHRVRAGQHIWQDDGPPDSSSIHRQKIEPWLTALAQAEHVNMLVGSGLTTAISNVAGGEPIDMSPNALNIELFDAVEESAKRSAEVMGRGAANIEDQIRAMLNLISGLNVLSTVAESGRSGPRLPKSARRLLPDWRDALETTLNSLLKEILRSEREIQSALSSNGDLDLGNEIRRILAGFLLPFASRSGTKDRLHVFTTNYDRLLEFSCGMIGLRVIDRFVGTLTPVFRASRLDVDVHYNPPGIRGEPRYLEGVIRLTKLHGSIDWCRQRGASGSPEVQRYSLPFGATEEHSELRRNAGEKLLIYPNPAKDIETLEFPYAELFRDFSSAICRPNAVLITYGYGFGDDHINRVIAHMLELPSSHLVIISYSDPGGRIARFLDLLGREDQISLLLGSHFGDIRTLVDNYLPKPAIDRHTWKMMDILKRRSLSESLASAESEESDRQSGE